MKAFY